MGNALSNASSIQNLSTAWQQKRSRIISSCFGVDRQTGRQFSLDVGGRISAISNKIRAGYEPDGLLAIPKPKDGGGHRIICVPTVADRLVQFSILNELRPRLKAAGLDNSVSYGLAKTAARSVIGARNFACKARGERGWVYKTDIQKFFDNLDRGKLASAVVGAVSQRSLRALICKFIQCEVSDGIETGWKKIVAESGLEAGVGVRQGMPLSPFFAGAYLRRFDKWLIGSGLPAARYVDDIVVFFETEKAARSFHSRMVAQMDKLGLVIGEIDDTSSKTTLYAPDEPADFLGMQITRKANGYKLCVSEKTKNKIGEKFIKLSSVSGLAERDVKLTTMRSYLNSIRAGYLNAYDGADNLVDLENDLSALCDGAQNAVLTELFGEKLGHLTDAEKRFVGLVSV